jgi:hypothetical protein
MAMTHAMHRSAVSLAKPAAAEIAVPKAIHRMPAAMSNRAPTMDTAPAMSVLSVSPVITSPVITSPVITSPLMTVPVCVGPLSMCDM